MPNRLKIIFKSFLQKQHFREGTGICGGKGEGGGEFSVNRPYLADSVIELPCPSAWMSVCLRHWGAVFLGLLLALRSHAQFQARKIM